MQSLNKVVLPLSLMLLAGCGGVNTDPAEVQPISGSPLPVISFTQTEISAPESGDVELAFTVLNSGPAAITRVLTNDGVVGSIVNSTVILTIPNIELHEVSSSITIEVEFGGQKGTTNLPFTILNNSGLLVAEQITHFLESASVLGQEDLTLASAVSDISVFEGVDLSNQLNSLNETINTFRVSDESISTNSLLLNNLKQYLENDLTELELTEALLISETIYLGDGYANISRHMRPFWNYLNDYSGVDLSTVLYSTQIAVYSRYVGNKELGMYNQEEWVFNEPVNYLSSILPSIVGTTPCEVSPIEVTE